MGTDRTHRTRQPQMTIGLWMLFFVGFALLLVFVRLLAANALQDSLQIVAFVAIVVISAAVFVLDAPDALRIALGSRCPQCSKGSIGLVKAIPFGPRYYRCLSCGAKLKRSDGAVSWQSCRPDEDHFFQGSPRVATWSDGPVRAQPKAPETRTVGGLLKSKQIRQVEPPDEAPRSAGPNSDLPTKKSNRSPSLGVKKEVATRLFQTLDAIRCTKQQ